MELTKDEALELMDLQFKVLSAEADLRALLSERKAMIEKLASVYGVDLKQFNIDVRHGCFVPCKEKPDGQPT